MMIARSVVPLALVFSAVQVAGCEPPAPSERAAAPQEQTATPPEQPTDAPELDPGAAAETFDRQASGTFEPVVTPEDSRATTEGSQLGRHGLEKRFHGDLEGTAEGWMLTALTPTEGSAGYVAIEEVRGTLEGREGSFLLQHHGLMDRGAQSLVIDVIPDSGTGELGGIAGRMSITIDESGHHYELLYSLAPTGGG